MASCRVAFWWQKNTSCGRGDYWKMPAWAMSCALMEVEIETTEDAVLGGRLRLRQPVRGHRVGHDAILLAAATGACGGEHAVDLGAGVGAAGLALAARVTDLKVTLVEVDPVLCSLATYNARLNHLDNRVKALVLDVENASAFERGAIPPDCADRVLMNPPFHDERRQNASPDPRRRLAHVGAPGDHVVKACAQRSVSEETDDFLFEYAYPSQAGRIPALAALLDARMAKNRDDLATEAVQARREYERLLGTLERSPDAERISPS